MRTLNDYVKEYTEQLRKGDIQKAYKGIMSFMSALKTDMERRYPEYKSSALYFGYMDMTYFAFTPEELRNRGLKIALVYLHEQNRFEVWLGGANRKIQAEYIELFKQKHSVPGKVSKVSTGVDSIIELDMLMKPDFNDPDVLTAKIEKEIIMFADKIISALMTEK